jgi:hypothetical protein
MAPQYADTLDGMLEKYKIAAVDARLHSFGTFSFYWFSEGEFAMSA